MLTTLRYTISHFRGQILGWGVGIAALGLLIVAFYDVFMERQADFMQMIEGYPPEFLAFFGGDAAALSTPEGYLGMYGFSLLPLVVGIYALIAGSGLVASDEESGRLDLILAYPVSRAGLFFGRLLAFVGATIAILILGWLGFVVPLVSSSLDMSWGQMALPFLSVLAQAVVYGTLALFLSMIMPSRRSAAAVAGLVMVTSYFLSSMKALNEGLGQIARFLPYDYFQGGAAIDGLNMGWFLGLVAVGAVLALLAWWRFSQRDVRVAGEGSWPLPAFSFPRLRVSEDS
ncbi:MAG: ABC transporter permease subunit [Candidatus Promineifilaceae bacterium]